ncbi:MAG TPA: polysaccharide deacetylase family protein [Polyangiaceae bacterium]|nr:polysaccharide deacetylase family protein [Polyangiaceae bacterium]
MGEARGEMGEKLCAISVDLDEIPFYHQIHGLPPPGDASSDAVFDIALERLSEFARSQALPLTLFVIGSTLERKENGQKLRALAEAGHELGNHTFGHRYDLTRLDAATMRNEIEFAQDAIEKDTGRRPVGFRAPGYTVTDELLGLVEHAGFLYDSSVFPCPVYWAAKGAAISAIRLQGRRSHSVLDTPRVLTAPTRPYRIGHPYWKRGGGLLELPIQVTRGARLPFFGTSVTVAGPLMARQLARTVAGEPLVNLELHGIDVLDVEDGLGHLVKFQHDVRIPHQRKLAALTAVVETLREAGHKFVRLDEAARTFA